MSLKPHNTMEGSTEKCDGSRVFSWPEEQSVRRMVQFVCKGDPRRKDLDQREGWKTKVTAFALPYQVSTARTAPRCPTGDDSDDEMITALSPCTVSLTFTSAALTSLKNGDWLSNQFRAFIELFSRADTQN